MRRLIYYSHRFTSEDPDEQKKNLVDAIRRFVVLADAMGINDSVTLWAPWLDMAEAGIDEDLAWIAIDKCIRASDGIVLDKDGAELSPGMIRERDIMFAVGGAVEVIE